jgi:O-glycosyl hydrolase
VILCLTAVPYDAAAQGNGLTPFVECVVDMGNNLFVAYFGYTNDTGEAAEIPLGENNYLTPDPQDPNQQPPTRFRPNGSLDYPLVVFGVEFDGSDLTWTINGQTAVANQNSPACPLTTTPVEIYPDETHQTITGWGGAFVHDSSKSLQEGYQDAVSQYNLDHFQVTHFRVRMTLDAWEPTNDDDDPYHFNNDGFVADNRSTRVFQFMQNVTQTDDQIIASIWDIPGWMAIPAEDATKFSVSPDMYDEIIESMTAWLLYARDEYGVEVDYVSFNEPNLGINVILSSEQYAALAALGGARFAEEGLSTRWVFAEANNIAGTPTYTRLVWEDETARPYLGPFVFHSWDANVSDRTMLQIRDWAVENNLETWITETGYDPALWERPEEFRTWDNAVQIARLYSRLFKLTGANVLFYWQMMDDYPLVSADGTEPYPAFYILQQFQREFPIDSVIVGTSDNTDTLYSVAAQSDSHFVLHLTNTAQVPEQLNVSGLPAGTYYYISSRSGAMMQQVQTFTVESGTPLQFVLPRLSIGVLTTQLPEES